MSSLTPVINDEELLENIEEALHRDIEELIAEETNRRPTKPSRKEGSE